MNKKYLLLATLIVTLLVLVVTQVYIFEDGSFGIGTFPYLVTGCFPLSICNP